MSEIPEDIQKIADNLTIMRLLEDNATLNTRIAELVEQADAAYAPYRERVMAARAEVDALAARLAAATSALAQAREALAAYPPRIIDAFDILDAAIAALGKRAGGG